jgi:hypothetical protein
VRADALARVSGGGQALQGRGLPGEVRPGLVPRREDPGVTGNDERSLGGLDVDDEPLHLHGSGPDLQRMIRAVFRFPQGFDREREQEKGPPYEHREQHADGGGPPGQAAASAPVGWYLRCPQSPVPLTSNNGALL